MIHENALDVSTALDPRLLTASCTKLKRKPLDPHLSQTPLCAPLLG